MKKYALKRIVTSLFTLLAILLVLFILMQLMPGSPFNDEKLNADQRACGAGRHLWLRTGYHEDPGGRPTAEASGHPEASVH